LIYFSKSVFKCCTCWAWLRTFCISWPEAIDLRDEIGFYQAIQSALKKSEISERDDVDLDHAIQQLRPFLRIDASNPVSVMDLWKETLTLTSNYMDKLPYSVISLSLNKPVLDMQPFIWNKFKVCL
jgi:hypothetical protein